MDQFTLSQTPHLEEIEKILSRVLLSKPVGPPLLHEYKEFLSAALGRKPMLTYGKIALVFNEKLKLDGRTKADGTPIKVTAQIIGRFVERSLKGLERREAAVKLLREPPTALELDGQPFDSHLDEQVKPAMDSTEVSPNLKPSKSVPKDHGKKVPDISEFMTTQREIDRRQNPFLHQMNRPVSK